MSDTSTDFGSLFGDAFNPAPTPSFDTTSQPSPVDTTALSAGLSTNMQPSVGASASAAPSVSPQSGGGGFFDTLGTNISNWASQPSNLLKLGLGAGTLGLGLYEQNQAGAQGAAAQQQISQIPQNLQQLSQATQQQLNQISQQYQSMVTQASQAMQNMSQPMMQEYSQLITLTNQGQLSPANEQIMDAARAQLAQNYSNQGAVGAEQGQTQLSDLYQQLLASQQQQALQLFQTASPGVISGIETGLTGAQQAAGYQISGLQTALNTAGVTDSYLMQAIQAGLQNDQVSRESLGQFTSAIVNILGGGGGKTNA